MRSAQFWRRARSIEGAGGPNRSRNLASTESINQTFHELKMPDSTPRFTFFEYLSRPSGRPALPCITSGVIPSRGRQIFRINRSAILIRSFGLYHPRDRVPGVHPPGRTRKYCSICGTRM